MTPIRIATAILVLSSACKSPTEAPGVMRPQTIALLATPKAIYDFSRPDVAVAHFFQRYMPLMGHAAEVVVILGVGNSDHVLQYRGIDGWDDEVEWARTTDHIPTSDRVLDYHQLAEIVRSFKDHATAAGINFKIYDLVDSGGEFTLFNVFKYHNHPECIANAWESFDVRARLHADDRSYASAPNGISEGTLCGEFLVDQLSHYLNDLGFDGILYKNQLGTRGRWTPGNGPGYTAAEAAGIEVFLEYSERVLTGKDIMWFDSYNNTRIERETFSFPSGGYRYFDYLVAAGFCVVTDEYRYLDNLRSKLQIQERPAILATLDYVDPWYTYNSATSFPGESARLEEIALRYRFHIDGIMLFANDEAGALIPRHLVESFASRYFGL
ncbi:MAG TPA: hypothetical protein VMM17_02260 [Gemmatimonadaceae bacterium]|nr:hypothetical protein [Gemmatimonadaceae bacterium]